MSNYETPDYTDVSSVLSDNSERNEQNIKNSNSGWKRSPVWEYFDQQAQRCNRALTRFLYIAVFRLSILLNVCIHPINFQIPINFQSEYIWINQELSQVVSRISDDIRDSDNITLGIID
ncbi:hypothetical protein RIR_jg5748.t1 [Rhizophagus irregularis DAOM 181602=DAOM 197198]|nr:hypothetical protein RIR_jg5748.t1 [Rhizophagus irregularis DAOM 181602=DAOM 197198]